MKQFYNRQNPVIALWLGVMCFAIIVTLSIGGVTRLTESGLSITEWNPVFGILPPTNDASWNIEFDKYKQYPEYIEHNTGMSISEFKSIYLLEFIHRIAGRVTSLVYVLPLIFFFIRGYIGSRDTGMYMLALLLLALQGVMGWYMVKSGLISKPYVSHYCLAGHLMLAVFLYIIMFWQLMMNSFDVMLLVSDIRVCHLSFWCLLSISLLLIQMMLGAFTAGLDAGLVYNSFPLMGEGLIPYELLENNLSIENWSDPVFIQFIHRMIAYLLFVVICVFCLHGLHLGNSKFLRITIYVFLALILQMSLGIVTLLYNVPIIPALLHQLGAVLLLSCLLWSYFLIKSSAILKKS